MHAAPPGSGAGLAHDHDHENDGWSLGGDLDVSRAEYGAMKLTGWPRGDALTREDLALLG